MSIEHELELEVLDPHLYRSAQELWRPAGSRGVFGGCVIGQALAAAGRTVDEGMFVHSLHSYFILPGDNTIPILYDVERVRDGKSYATRTVEAIQRGRAIFTMTCSFSRREESRMHHDTPQVLSVPPPEDLLPDSQLMESDQIPVRLRRILKANAKSSRLDPIEHRRVFGTFNSSMKPHEKYVATWLRSRATISRPANNAVALGYLSDSAFLTVALSANGIDRGISMMTSLDHSIYFHVTDFSADDWMLYITNSPWSNSGRALVTGHFYDRNGRLLASTVQEGLIRLSKI